MSTATEMLERFNLIPNYVWDDGEESEFLDQQCLDAFIEMCDFEAVRVEIKDRRSCDPSIEFTFADGTVLHVATPAQQVYPAWVQA